MEKNWKILILGIIIGLAIAGGFIYYQNHQVGDVPPWPEPPISLPPAVSGKCALEGCHGLDITCGPNLAQMCTEMYQAGDNCRQYAKCGTVDGKCQLLLSPKFDSCKSCVQNCEATYSNQPDKVMECESRCAD